MKKANILIIGGGIGGLTSAIALRRHEFDVTVIERDPSWSVYGVGIIQQSNVLRAMHHLQLLDEYVAAGAGFDTVEVFTPEGVKVARIPSPKLVDGYPANMGVGRPALHKMLGDRTIASGAQVRLGITAVSIDDQDDCVHVAFSDGSSGDYDIVIGADGVYSQIRAEFFRDAPKPEFTGQAVWRYNLPRPEGLDSLQAYNGATGVGLVPISGDLMYIFVTTPEPDNPWYPKEGMAARMRGKMADCSPAIRALAEHITDDAGVVYRPLETLMMHGPWHNGRVVLLGDAIHATTPHLGQGAGMAIEDSIVLAEELARADTPEAAFLAYRERRYDRCRYIVEQSLAICMGQLGKGPAVDNHKATADMFAMVSQPI
ncbi:MULTISPECIES: FAD-dependent oxidoreductase [unclassified Sphingobium]|uniref:FAD-dependent oxidoreductase n=1 Tax=unclassified Sphingobium TaxID=2611147 RepID=UPI000D15F7B8|nr:MULTISPECIES: FAD-dependent oxidoreductase [unclassified Sphingobium]MBG6119764.1 2-polyprenyl-6-methoxyphenol hydroxylase-like FAD-dependent oxidoreductase [Sphingobium sp. JAI105]PSO10593.1 2-polyprenyl-6-methoxyphenol hydroxylase [Sphingobium sp. AEW4]TWD01191.1 2-polyprenyl-6-methoxyphenol hydroxylase-like FAD-dependent oxidoreductase [Sphingobium sp. AEW010]TWD19939.1 2-polyprenyl-6-methoxyphenol hydroxylase-like FAD-dependent oxidoreductase [Sphingobium sp. AEW013]TWD22555.1 2-polypre